MYHLQLSKCQNVELSPGAVVMSVCTTKTEMCNPISVLASLKKKKKNLGFFFSPRLLLLFVVAVYLLYLSETNL